MSIGRRNIGVGVTQAPPDERRATVAENVLDLPLPALAGAEHPLQVAPRPQEIPWHRYSGRINYSACNESSESEIEALKPAPGKRLLSITAGGGRVLDLLVGRPDQVWAVDINPCQTALLELKIAAMRSLDHAEFLNFLGVRPCRDRLQTYASLAGELSPKVRKFFDRKPAMIRRGVVYQGNLERFFRYIAPVIGFCRPRILQLFRFDDLEEQRRFLDQEWERPLWRMVGTVLSSKIVLRMVLDDPGFLRFLPDDSIVHSGILDSLKGHFRHNLAKENHLLSMVFFGRYMHEPSLPQYLRASTFPIIKEALESTSIELFNAPITEILQQTPANTLDGYSLSDVSSYLCAEGFSDLLTEVVRSARPGARVCVRRCLCPPVLPAAHRESLHRFPDLELRLARHDKAAVHHFMVGEIR